MTEELDPCGFCGGKAEQKYNLSPSQWIECTQCGFQMAAWPSAWNDMVKRLKIVAGIRQALSKTLDIVDELYRKYGTQLDQSDTNTVRDARGTLIDFEAGYSD